MLAITHRSYCVSAQVNALFMWTTYIHKGAKVMKVRAELKVKCQNQLRVLRQVESEKQDNIKRQEVVEQLVLPSRLCSVLILIMSQRSKQTTELVEQRVKEQSLV